MWQKISRISIYVVLVALIGGGFYALYPKQAKSQNGAVNNPPTAYLETNEVSASFKMAGRVAELLVKEGEPVKKGQVIAKLQSDEIQAKVNQAQAAVALAEGKIAEAKGASATAEAKRSQGQTAVKLTAESVDAQIKQAEAAVAAAQAKVDALKTGARPEEKKQAEIQLNATKEVYQVAETNLKRLQTLLDQGLIAQVEVDKVKVSYQEAKGKYDAAQQQYNLAMTGPREEEIRGAESLLEQAKGALELALANKTQVPVREGDVNAASASISQAEGAVQAAESGRRQAAAALEEAQTYLGYTELIAPVDGIITAQSAQLGELVGSGFPVFTIQSNDEKWAKFYFPEKDVLGLKVGDKVTVHLASSDEPIEGQVSIVAPAADFAIKKASQNMGDGDIRSFSVKVRFSKLPEHAATGMTVKWGSKVIAPAETAAGAEAAATPSPGASETPPAAEAAPASQQPAQTPGKEAGEANAH